MTQSAVSARVNPMVGKKLRTTVLTNLEAITAELAEGKVPVITPNPDKPNDTRQAKFSDIFAYRSFMQTNKLGEVEIKVSATGSAKNDPLMQRVVSDYLSKDQTPNCSLGQILAIDGAKISVKHHLSDLGKAVVASQSVEAGGEKPKRAPKVKAEKPAKEPKAPKVKAEKAEKPARAKRAAKANDADKPKRTRRSKEQIAADAAAGIAPKRGGSRRKAEPKGVEVQGVPAATSGSNETPLKTDWS